MLIKYFAPFYRLFAFLFMSFQAHGFSVLIQSCYLLFLWSLVLLVSQNLSQIQGQEGLSLCFPLKVFIILVHAVNIVDPF